MDKIKPSIADSTMDVYMSCGSSSQIKPIRVELRRIQNEKKI